MAAVKFRVAICGGGISGLCLAVLLSKQPDIQVDVYEASERFKEIGAGVMIWSRTWHILSEMGLASKFSQAAHAPPDGSVGVGFDYRRSDQPEEGSRFYLYEVPYGCIRFHRAHFLDVLVDALPPKAAHFGKRLRSYSRPKSGHLSLQFEDGTTAVCDLLVGCDGIKSVVRQRMFEEKVLEGEQTLSQFVDPIEQSGAIVYRGLIPVNHLIKPDGTKHRTIHSPVMWCGQSKHVVSYSISQESIVNLVACETRPVTDDHAYDGPWVTSCPQSELLESFADWEPELLELLQLIDEPTRWVIHQLKPLPTYMADKIVLVGDAAHAMTPHQGAGAGQAIEDAYVLARLISSPSTTLASLPLALRAYEHVRLPLATHVLKGSYQSGLKYEFLGYEGDDLTSLGPAIERQWDWLWESTPYGEANRALKWMKEHADSENTKKL